MRLVIPLPVRVASLITDAPPVFEPQHRLDIELLDRESLGELVDEIICLENQHLLEDVRLDAVIVGYRDYFSLREKLREFGWRGIPEDGTLAIHAVKIFMDPARHSGPPVPVYMTEEHGVAMIGLLRKRTASERPR